MNFKLSISIFRLKKKDRTHCYREPQGGTESCTKIRTPIEILKATYWQDTSPLSEVVKEGFVNLMEDLLNMEYSIIKTNLIVALEKISNVLTTPDLWSSRLRSFI
ncbi:hypothetical protein OUZ56_005468 [Daphnia magna]|uniref:Uncharacterized protein n=1 Tax=Daphnia magna TaxID=35525 RepID=A0ABQ9YSV4_9CRUS|nr:hypothetical protein OUZ56_005468 [Daphnia magna]